MRARASTSCLVPDLLSSSFFPRIYAVLEESVKGDTVGIAQLHLRGLDIKNIEPGLLGLGRSDPFVEISKKNADYAAGVVVWYVCVSSRVKGTISLKTCAPHTVTANVGTVSTDQSTSTIT